MSDPIPELPVRANDTQAGIDRFESQAVIVLAFAVTLSVMSYAILMQVLL